MRAITPPSMARTSGRRPSLGWQAARIVLAGSSRQAFLDARWIDWLLRAAPERRRRSLALRILSLSPHYFIYQWDRYPDGWSRRLVLEAESRRNRDSRRQITEQILAPLISRDARVLDFGCGPGFLASELRELGCEVVAVDVSSGALACARVLNPGPAYSVCDGVVLPVRDESIDVVCSIAVLQHIDPADWKKHLDEFARVLRPGGLGVCQVAVGEQRGTTRRPRGRLRARYSLRYAECSVDDVTSVLSRAGFVDVRVEPIANRATIVDDVGAQHVAVFRKPT